MIERISGLARSTARPGADAELGGFGGFFDARAAGYEDPLLVAASDGVGTKLLLAKAAGQHANVGIDLVAMCVNDLVVQGAEPLFFLDYFATGKLDVEAAAELVAGIASGCREAGCALIGGETAELPGLYRPGDYDLAGFAVGAVERGREITGGTIQAGDVVLGLPASGLHSNGFSLVRKIVDEEGLDLAAPAPFAAEGDLGTTLLTATRIYVRDCLALARAGLAKGFAHITGGGLLENLPRVLPPGLGAELDAGRWPMPPVFAWLAAEGVPDDEMLRTFNCGLGMLAIVADTEAETAAELLGGALPVGHIVETEGVAIGNLSWT